MKVYIQIVVLSLLISCQNKKGNFQKLNIFSDYEQGLLFAQKNQKPILLVFSAFGLGYDELINDFLLSKKIYKTILDKYVLIQLKIDDPEKLIKIDIAALRHLGLTKSSIQKILQQPTRAILNSCLQQDKYQSNVQPLYVILNSEGYPLIQPFGYTGRDLDFFMNQLNSGLQNK